MTTNPPIYKPPNCDESQIWIYTYYYSHIMHYRPVTSTKANKISDGKPLIFNAHLHIVSRMVTRNNRLISRKFLGAFFVLFQYLKNFLAIVKTSLAPNTDTLYTETYIPGRGEGGTPFDETWRYNYIIVWYIICIICVTASVNRVWIAFTVIVNHIPIHYNHTHRPKDKVVTAICCHTVCFMYFILNSRPLC